MNNYNFTQALDGLNNIEADTVNTSNLNVGSLIVDTAEITTLSDCNLINCTSETPANPTSVVNKTYVDDNFLDRINNLTQNINGLKTFTDDLTALSIYCDTSLYFRDINLGLNKALIFHQADIVYFDTLTIYDNYWKFKCFNIEQVVISQLSSTFNNKLISLEQARFDNFTPTCTVSSPTQINHLTRKDYVDNNFVYKTGSVTENITGQKTFSNSCIAGINFTVNTALFCNTLNARNPSVNTPRTLFTNLTTASTIAIGTNNTPITINSTAISVNGDTTFTNNLISNSQATFNTICPISNTNATLTNHLTTFGFNNGKYIDFLTDQTITGTKRFNTIFTGDHSWRDVGSPFTNRVQSYISGNNLAFVPQFANNTYTFYCKDSVPTQTSPLIINSASTTIANNLISNGEATFNTWVNLKFRTRIYDLNSPQTNYTQMYMLTNTFIIAPNANGDTIQFYCKDATLGNLQTFTSSALGNTSNVNLTCSASLITNNLTSPSTTGTNNIYTSLVSGGIINIGGSLGSNNIAGLTTFTEETTFNSDTTFSSDTRFVSNIRCEKAIYFGDIAYLTTNTPKIFMQDNVLYFDTDPQYDNSYQFYANGNPQLLIDQYTTEIKNNLISNSQATFNNICPISNTTATLTNHLTTLGFNNDKYVDFTTDNQVISGNKNFTNITTTRVLYSKDFRWNDAVVGGTNIQQTYLTGSTFAFVPLFNNNVYGFQCNDAGGTPTTPLIINSASTTIANNLISNGEATFNTWVNLKFRTRIYDLNNLGNYSQMYMLNNALILGPNANGDTIQFYCKDATLGNLQTFTSSALGNTSNVNLTCSSSLISNNLTSPTTTTVNNIYTTLVSGGEINMGGSFGTNNIYGQTFFNSASTFNLGCTFLEPLIFFNSGTNSEIEQTSGSQLVIRNTTNNKNIILSTKSASTGQVDSLTINTTSCDILPSTLNLTSSSTINILTPNNTTGVINFLNTLTTATINFCSTAFTSIFNLNARLAHKQVQYMNEVKTISATSLTLGFPIEQTWMFTSTGSTTINITLPELTASHQAGFNYTILKTASNTNSVIFTCQGTNLIRGFNSITGVSSYTRLSGTNTTGIFFTAEVSAGNFVWFVF